MKKSATALLASAALAAGLGCRSKADPAQEIRDTLSKAAQALEAGDAAGATAILDDRYLGPDGMNKAATRFYLAQVVKQGKLGVTLTGQDVGVNGQDAFEKVHVVFNQQGPGLLPDASKRVYLLHWRRQGSDWRLVDAQDLTNAPQ
jgi:ketosteroid isomerase-like protein